MSQKQEVEGNKAFDEQETVGVSPWMLSLVDELGHEGRGSHWSYTFEEFSFEIVEGRQSLWITSRFPAGGRVALRAAYCPDGELRIEEIQQVGIDNAVEIRLSSTVGEYRVEVQFPQSERAMLHYKTTLKPAAPLLIPFWPRDVIPLGNEDSVTDSEGVIYTRQIGPRSGLVYFSLGRPRAGSALYFQHLTSLNDYARQTETSLAESVGGEWPELGFALPGATEKTLAAGRPITISDAYVIFHAAIPQDDLAMARQFLDLLAQIYLALPRVETEYLHWPDLLKKSLRDLADSEACWSEERGRHYLNAYVGDSESPPESMVQLAVLLPLLEYADWSDEDIPITEEVLGGLPRFFDKEANVLGRWLTSAAHRLDGSEPQKKPEVMDSWYLYHSLINLSRLALRGDKPAQKLFLDSMEYAIKVAHKFDYRWPVFYDLYTLEVIKAETKEGEGGEKDVAGLYAHVMIQAWELTKDEQYLQEAKKAARSLKGLGFNLFYQANETLFGAGAMLRLWKETGDEEFLNLSYLSLANIFNNMWLWECNYGYAEHYKTYFALFPLKDAPYTAVYEELEAYAAFHDYLSHYDGNAPDWLKILIPEFIRHLLYKASFYYPPNLPGEVLVEKPKTGEIDPKLWIPIEDIYDGWEKAGQVGQEVYGAGLPFGIVPRQYWRVPNEKFMIYIDYPIKDFSAKEGQASFQVLGDQRLSCRMRIIPTARAALPDLEVLAGQGKTAEPLQARQTEEGHLEYTVLGDHSVSVQWKTKERKQPAEKKGSDERKGRKK